MENSYKKLAEDRNKLLAMFAAMDKSNLTFSDYKKKVLECLMKTEDLSEAEAEGWMSVTWESPLSDGAKSAEEELSICYEEGLNVLTTAQILVA